MSTYTRRRYTSLFLLLGAALLLLPAFPGFAQGMASSSVVVGQNARGENIVVQVIPLKFLDPVEAAELLAALGFPGTIVPVNPPRRPGGEAFGAQQSYGGRGTGGSQYGRGYDSPAQEAYGGYGQANERSRQYPGYQSPYGNR